MTFLQETKKKMRQKTSWLFGMQRVSPHITQVEKFITFNAIDLAGLVSMQRLRRSELGKALPLNKTAPLAIYIYIRKAPGNIDVKLPKPLCTGPKFFISPKSLSIEVPIPSDVLQLLSGNIETVQAQYFRSIHQWMPTLCTKNLRRVIVDMTTETTEPRADLALLLLC